MKYLIFLSLLFIINSQITFQDWAELEVGNDIVLPDPIKEGGMGLYESLNLRKSQRDFNNSIHIGPEIISQSVWACYGINREEEKLKTTPSATGWYPLMIYIFLEEGVFLYDADNHSVKKVMDGDHRSITGTQDFVKDARINFVMIADFKKKSKMDPDDEHKWRSMYLDTGHCAMALSLYASANNMKGVDRAMIEKEEVVKFLGLDPEKYILTLAFSLGY